MNSKTTPPKNVRRPVPCRCGVSWWLVAGTLVLGLPVGCGPDGPPRIPLHGKVTCGGELVPMGLVKFVSLGETDGPAKPTFTGAIVDGSYQLKTLGGVTPGSYRVEVEALRKAAPNASVRIAPERFAGSNSPLKITVDAESDARFDIELPKREGGASTPMQVLH